jgi:hypothetical protein
MILSKKNGISVRRGILTYSVGLQGFVDYKIPHPTVGLLHFCLESIGPPMKHDVINAVKHDVINAIITARRSDEASSRMHDSSPSSR